MLKNNYFIENKFSDFTNKIIANNAEHATVKTFTAGI